MTTQMERHYPSEDWPEVSPKHLNSRYHDVLNLADDGDQGQYTLVAHKRTSDPFVRKTLKKVLKGDDSPDRWRREVEVIRRLCHENIQKYKEACLCLIQGDIYLEYCSYGSLSHFKRYMDNHELPVPEAFAKHLFKGLVGALAYLHHGIQDLDDVRYPERWTGHWVPTWHCDITIDSVSLKMYARDVFPVAKLCKFNFACIPRRVGGTYNIPIWSRNAGTQGWVPPEHPTKSGRTDVFQVGAVIQCLCTPGWVAAEPEGGLPPQYSVDFQAAIWDAMTPEVEARPNAARLAELLDDFPPQYASIPLEAYERAHAEIP